MRRRSWLLDGAIALVLVVAAIVQATVPVPPFSDTRAGILIGTERWYLFLDGITDLRKFRDDTWTIQHFNGSVLHIAAWQFN